jgi:hypothetical protein
MKLSVAHIIQLHSQVSSWKEYIRECMWRGITIPASAWRTEENNRKPQSVETVPCRDSIPATPENETPIKNIRSTFTCTQYMTNTSTDTCNPPTNKTLCHRLRRSINCSVKTKAQRKFLQGWLIIFLYSTKYCWTQFAYISVALPCAT